MSERQTAALHLDQPGWHVERSAFIAGIQSAFQQHDAKNGLSKLIINVYGITGAGKTTLIHQIFEYFEQDYTVVLLNFDPSGYTDPAVQVRPWGELLALLQATLPALKDLPMAEMPASLTVACRVAHLNAAAHRPCLLLLDALDDLAVWKWLQENIIRPLVDQGRTRVICTSHGQIFWHFWELREQCEPRELPPFTLEETHQFLRRFDREIFAGTLHALTQGYPLGLRHALALLLAAAPAVSPEAPVDLAQISPMAREALRYAGLLRVVEAPVMQQLLTLALPQETANAALSNQDVFALLREWRGAGCLARLRKAAPLQFVAAVRHAAEADLLAANPELYYRICDSLAAIYARQATTHPLTSGSAFNDWLYFSAAPLVVETTPAAVAAWTEQARQIFGRTRLAGSPLVARIYGDAELVDRLQTAGLLPALNQLIAAYLNDEPPALPLLHHVDLTRYINAYRQAMLQAISARLPIQRLPPSIRDQFAAFLQCLTGLDRDFDVRILLQHFGGPPGPLNEALALLNSWNFISYQRARRTYRLHALLQHLLRVTLPLDSSDPVVADPPLDYSLAFRPQ